MPKPEDIIPGLHRDYLTRLNETVFDYTKRKSFRGWGALHQWPAINPRNNEPKVYVYISRQVIIRNAH